MNRLFKQHPSVVLGTGLTMGLLIGLGAVAGMLITLNWPGASSLTLPETALHAAATDSNESFAVATGPVDEDAEGVFFLDFLTGEIQCAVLSFRIGKFNALFKGNVVADLGIDKSKKPSYLLVTGQINFPRGGGNARPAQSVAYVVDSNTGNFAAYGIPWDRTASTSGRPQAGALTLLDVGKARAQVIRD